MSRLNVDKITGATGTASGAPITLSGDTATLGSGVAMAANHSGVKTALNASGTAPIYACRAWVNFDGNSGSGTGNSDITIRGSGNVTSITDNGTGDYTINLDTALSDEDYSLNVNASGDSGGIYANQISIFSKTSSNYKQAPTNNTARIIFRNANFAFHDPEYVCAIFFR